MTNHEIASLVTKAVADNDCTKSFRIKVVSDADTIRLMGKVNSYFQKQLLITVVRKICPHKEFLVNDVEVEAGDFTKSFFVVE